MCSSDVTTHNSGREFAESLDNEAGSNDAETLTAFERRIRVEESVIRRRFRTCRDCLHLRIGRTDIGLTVIVRADAERGARHQDAVGSLRLGNRDQVVQGVVGHLG